MIGYWIFIIGAPSDFSTINIGLKIPLEIDGSNYFDHITSKNISLQFVCLCYSHTYQLSSESFGAMRLDLSKRSVPSERPSSLLPFLTSKCSKKEKI